MLKPRQKRLTFEINRKLHYNDLKIPHKSMADARSMKLKSSQLIGL